MKDKDPNEDEFNQDEQDNINEADDSFGLPDLDFNTLDDEPEEADPEPEAEASEPESSEVEDTVEEPETSVEDTVESEVEESSEDEDQEIAAAETEEDDSENEDSPAEETASSTGYVPPKPESNAPRIIAALLITVIVSGAIWYFAFYRPQKLAEEKAVQEELDKKEAARLAAEKKKQEEARLAAEKAANEAADADEASANQPVFSIISEPTGRYYIVIASFIDEDMAKDMGEKLKAGGTSSALLAPKGNKKFNRLTLGDFGSFNEAQEEANKLKGEHGDGLWVLKY